MRLSRSRVQTSVTTTTSMVLAAVRLRDGLHLPLVLAVPVVTAVTAAVVVVEVVVEVVVGATERVAWQQLVPAGRVLVRTAHHAAATVSPAGAESLIHPSPPQTPAAPTAVEVKMRTGRTFSSTSSVFTPVHGPHVRP